jgi:hypothetical protein
MVDGGLDRACCWSGPIAGAGASMLLFLGYGLGLVGIAPTALVREPLTRIYWID